MPTASTQGWSKLRIATKDGSIPFADATAQQIRDAMRALAKAAVPTR